MKNLVMKTLTIVLVFSIFGFFISLFIDKVYGEDQWILPDGTILTRTDVYEVQRDGYKEKYGRGDYDNPEKLAEIGAKPFVVIKDFDKTYYEEDGYVDSQEMDTVTRIYNKKPKTTIEQVKSWRKYEALKTKVSGLSQTDAEVLECLELGSKIPKEILDARKVIRERYTTECERIEAFTDYDLLVNDIKGVSDEN